MFSFSSIKKQSQDIIGRTINAILPARCIATGKLIQEPGRLHGDAWGKLSFIQDPVCITCGTPFDYGRDGQKCLDCLEQHVGQLDFARSALVYDDASRGMILRFKHADDIHSAKLFAGWLAGLMDGIPNRTDIILPVPLHVLRHIKRGYNQSSLLARHLSGQTGIAYSDHILHRVKATPSQGGLTPAERAENVHFAFAVSKDKADGIKGRHIALIDDVRTTGATLESCARVLKDAGAATVIGLTLARVV